MPKHPLISIPLDIADVRVLQTELTKDDELILTVESTLSSTTCRRCGRIITAGLARKYERDRITMPKGPIVTFGMTHDKV